MIATFVISLTPLTALAKPDPNNGTASGVVLLESKPVAEALVQIFAKLPQDVSLTEESIRHGAPLPGISLAPTAVDSSGSASRPPLFIATTGDNGTWTFENLTAGTDYLVTTQVLNSDGAVLLAKAQIVTAWDSTSALGPKQVQSRIAPVLQTPSAPAFSTNAATVYYVTDRAKSPNMRTTFFDQQYFQNRRNNLSMFSSGICNVEVEGQHRVRCSEMGYPLLQDTMRQIQEKSLAQPSKGLVLYVHGFASDFGDAVRSGAIISTRLKHPVLVYDWTSAKDWSPTGYAGDEELLTVSLDSHRDDLLDILADPGSINTIIIAHSLGSRAVASLAESVADAKRLGAKIDVRLCAVVLAAADLYVEDFRADFNAFEAFTRRINSYASWKDSALFSSAAAHSGHVRVGDDAGEIADFADVISVDVSSIDNPSLTDLFGHGYITGDNHILDDVSDFISNHKRSHLSAQLANKVWIFENGSK